MAWITIEVLILLVVNVSEWFTMFKDAAQVFGWCCSFFSGHAIATFLKLLFFRFYYITIPMVAQAPNIVSPNSRNKCIFIQNSTKESKMHQRSTNL